jgi:hypothetical protein
MQLSIRRLPVIQTKCVQRAAVRWCGALLLPLHEYKFSRASPPAVSHLWDVPVPCVSCAHIASPCSTAILNLTGSSPKRLSGSSYFTFDREILGLDCDLLIHTDVNLTHRSFTAEKNVSVFQTIAALRPGRIVIGGTEPDSLPEEVFNGLLERFPNTYELRRYVLARVSAVVRDFIETGVDGEKAYHRYMNKRLDSKAPDILGMFRDEEIQKYEFLHEKLARMLANEETYSEAKWQAEILQIILLLYPKYIRAFEKAPVRDTYSNTTRELDILLVAASCNVDIAEIKRPFGKCIVTNTQYRDNYIPLRELSGTVMQIEKYIFYFNKWGRAGEEYLTHKYKDQLPEGFSIKITNPGGFIIMGRDDNLSEGQRQDFEVVKRKYKSVIDIIT